MTTISPAIQAAIDELNTKADELEAAATVLLAALEGAGEAGAVIRESDIATIKTRFLVQIPYGLRFKAGQLMPPLTGTLNLNLDSVDVSTAP